MSLSRTVHAHPNTPKHMSEVWQSLWSSRALLSGPTAFDTPFKTVESIAVITTQRAGIISEGESAGLSLDTSSAEDGLPCAVTWSPSHVALAQTAPSSEDSMKEFSLDPKEKCQICPTSLVEEEYSLMKGGIGPSVQADGFQRFHVSFPVARKLSTLGFARQQDLKHDDRPDM